MKSPIMNKRMLVLLIQRVDKLSTIMTSHVYDFVFSNKSTLTDLSKYGLFYWDWLGQPLP